MTSQSKEDKISKLFEHLRRELYVPHPIDTNGDLKSIPLEYKFCHAPLG